VSAEEKGLLGSQYYTDFDPIVPLENTVANLNIDMIGRTDPKRKKRHTKLYLFDWQR
jgi:Zn-dependent M28 family amino/carboxypeptidase